MKRLRLFALLVALVLVGCGGDKAEPTPEPTPAPTETPRPTYTARPTYTPIPTYTVGPSATPQPTATDTQVPPAEPAQPETAPQLSLLLLGCDTGTDIMHGLGEVTNAYVTVENTGTADANKLRVTLSGSDEEKAHPDKTQEITVLAVGHEVTLKLTIDTDRDKETTITIEATSADGSRSALPNQPCQEIDPKTRERVSGILGVALPTTLRPTDTPQPSTTIAASDTPVPIPPTATQTSIPPTATPIPPTAAPTAVPTCAYAMAFAQDVTIPDGTAFDPGATFIKTWALKNSGTCAWESGFALKHVSGARMSAPPQVDVPEAQPGAVVNVSVPMQAPSTPGTYVGQWKLCDASRCYTGLVTVQIVVKASAQAAPAANPCAYIGNRNSKIFHYAGCSSAQRMSASNRVCFATREDAIRAGHRPCQRCNP